MPVKRFAVAVIALLVASAPALAQVPPDEAKALYERVTPSIVAVQYTWETELGRRELTGAGVVVGGDGLVMTSLGLFDLRIPDKQMRDFKVLVPNPEGGDPDEVDAVFLGRDERTDVAFVRAAKTPEKPWAAVKFEEAPLAVGDAVLSVGLLPEDAGYKTYLMQGHVGALLRGPVPLVLVGGGGLGNVGTPVFNAAGQAVGFVNAQQNQQVFLNDPRDPLAAAMRPPSFFVPTRDFALSLASPPKEGELMKVPWLGVPQNAMAGLNQDVAELLGLENTPAVEIGDVLAGSPAQKAGLQSGDILLKVNGEDLQRGDSPEEMPEILVRQIRRMDVGDDVRLTLFGGKGKEPRELTLELTERPKGPNLADRFYAEDLGFSVRETVFIDTYLRRLPPDAAGVVVALLKPNSSAASAELQVNDMITEINGTPVEGLAQFKETYEELRKSKPREAIVLQVTREGSTQVIRIEPPQ